MAVLSGSSSPGATRRIFVASSVQHRGKIAGVDTTIER